MPSPLGLALAPLSHLHGLHGLCSLHGLHEYASRTYIHLSFYLLIDSFLIRLLYIIIVYFCYHYFYYHYYYHYCYYYYYYLFIYLFYVLFFIFFFLFFFILLIFFNIYFILFTFKKWKRKNLGIGGLHGKGGCFFIIKNSGKTDV